MFTQARFEEITLLLWGAHDNAQDMEFRNLWCSKLREFQRVELYENNLRQQEGNPLHVHS